MKIISPSFEILTPLDGQAILKHIELCGRVCYKSEDKITDTSAATFVASMARLSLPKEQDAMYFKKSPPTPRHRCWRGGGLK